ncbi:MAG: hypothetical protein F9B45_08265 [Phycisphaera sp. RhM]|nr:hypothetical protein [Phycisphaera sp. RhM]
MCNARDLSLLLVLISSVVCGQVAAQDTTAPSVSITSLTNDDAVGGKVDVTADANDDVGVAEVEFYKDGTLIESDTTSPYSVQFDFNADAPDQTYRVKAIAKDAAGNENTVAIEVRKPKHSFRPPGSTLSDNGAFFKVWAPHANKVALVGDFNQWDRSDHLLWMRAAGGSGLNRASNRGKSTNSRSMERSTAPIPTAARWNIPRVPPSSWQRTPFRGPTTHGKRLDSKT